MANIVQVKRGALADVPVLNAGEFGFSTDTHQIFIGDGAANHELAKQTSLHAQGTDTALGAQSENLNMNTHQIEALSVPDAVGEAIRQTAKITESALETVIDAGHGVIDYRIETGKSVTIDAYQYIDVRLVNSYIIEGTGSLIIKGNGFLRIGA